MRLQNYVVSGDSITLSLKELTRWREYYREAALKSTSKQMEWIRIGKGSTIDDIIKLSDPYA